MKKWLVVLSTAILAVCVLFLIKDGQQPIILNAEYINSDVLIGMESIDDIVFSTETDAYIACICSVEDEEMMLLILENSDTYDLHFRHSFSLKELTNDSSAVMTDAVLSSRAELSYNLFLNPKTSSVQIQGISRKVHVIPYRVGNVEYNIGFWWFEN